MSTFDDLADRISAQGFRIVREDRSRPWGGFFAIDETQAQLFANVYFDGIGIETINISGKLSPKILLIAPRKRVSWQYHHRRAEVWQVLEGPVGVAVSDTDTEEEVKWYGPGDLLRVSKGQRHRLIGLDGWGVVAEIWEHTDASHPSDEDDIVRVEDDFGR